MKGTYDDNTNFYLEVFLSDEEPNRDYFYNSNAIKIYYESVDGFYIDGSLKSDLVKLIYHAGLDGESNLLHMNLYGWRKIQVAENGIIENKPEDNYVFDRTIENENIVDCIGAIRLDKYRSKDNIKFEQAFALEIEKNWPKYYTSEKRVALCFLEKYVLPFEAVSDFSKTGKLDMSSFEDNYGKSK